MAEGGEWGHDGIPLQESGDASRGGRWRGALASCPQASWRRVALAGGGAAVLALAVHARALVTPLVPADTPGLELSPVPALTLGGAGAPLAWLAHAVVAALVTVIVLRLTGKLFAAVAAGLVFAAHPLTVEAVSWSEARAVPVGFALSLAGSALWFFVAEDARERSARTLARVGAFALLAGGAVLHPMSATAPLCLAAAVSVMGRSRSDDADDARRPLAWPIVLAGLVLFVGGTALHAGPDSSVNAAPAVALPAVLLDAVKSLVQVFPLMPDYSVLYVGAGAWTLVYGLVGLALVFPVLERIVRKRVPAARGALTWIAVALVLGILVAGLGERHDWALYLGVVGFAWLLGSVLALSRRALGGAGSAAVLVAATVALAAFTFLHQGPAWRSPEDILMLMKRVPARGQLDFAERLLHMGGAKEKRAAELDRRAKELAREKRDGLAREFREESSRLRGGATWLYRQSSSAIYEAEAAFAPEDARLLSTKGLVALRKKEFRRARELLEKAVENMPPGPERAKVLVRLGGTWEGIGDRAKAIERYEQAAGEAPEDPTPLVLLGMARRLSGEFTKALAAFNRATELRPDDAELQHRLGLIFMEMFMLAEAEAALLRAIKADPSSESCRDDLDTVRRLRKGQKDPEKAREAFAEGEFFETRATEAITGGDEKEAYRLLISAAYAYKRAIAFAQHNHRAHYRRGVCLAIYGSSLKKYEARRDLLGEAVEHFETALLYSKNNEDYLFELGKAWQALGRTKEAEKVFRDLLRVNPSSARAHHRLARLYAYQANDPLRARDELEKAKRLGLEPEPEFLENLEDIEYGPYTEQERAAERAAQSASSEAEISLGIEGPVAAAAAYARAYDALDGFARPLLVRKRARAAAWAAACSEQAKDLAKALEWYGKAAALHSGPYGVDVARVKRLIKAPEATPGE